MLADGRIDGDKLRVFHTTAPFADYVWVARNNLAPALQEKVAAALIALQPGQDDAVLDEELKSMSGGQGAIDTVVRVSGKKNPTIRDFMEITRRDRKSTRLNSSH